ncbi:MAG: CPBP family intramembrane metalloprotease [Anaerolineales bacterium]|nr:CPBP family intramembrane metalloprotease [Anaerolineales bacterium]
MTSAHQPETGSFLSRNPRPAIAITAVAYLLLGFLEQLPGTYLPPVLYFLTLGVLALVLMPFVLGLPNGRKPLRNYLEDIRLLPVKPLVRNILLGLLLAALALAAILAAALATGRFALDWSHVPALRWVKGLTRGIWEEVFFRGIILVLFMKIFSKGKAVFFATLLFALIHINPLRFDAAMAVDVFSIFLIGLLFTYVVLKTGSLLPAIVFHYVYDIFVLLVQNTPGADQTTALALLYAFLWPALALGALLTKYIVEHWPAAGAKS